MESAALFLNNSMRNVVFGVLFRVILTVVVLPAIVAVNTGKFCRLFAPVSASPTSLRVTPLSLRSIPILPLEKILLVEIWLPAPEVESS